MDYDGGSGVLSSVFSLTDMFMTLSSVQCMEESGQSEETLHKLFSRWREISSTTYGKWDFVSRGIID